MCPLEKGQIKLPIQMVRIAEFEYFQENMQNNKRKLKFYFWQGQDLNLRPQDYEPHELPDCSTLLLHKKSLLCSPERQLVHRFLL
jgi:hypothetical protein